MHLDLGLLVVGLGEQRQSNFSYICSTFEEFVQLGNFFLDLCDQLLVGVEFESLNLDLHIYLRFYLPWDGLCHKLS